MKNFEIKGDYFTAGGFESKAEALADLKRMFESLTLRETILTWTQKKQYRILMRDTKKCPSGKHEFPLSFHKTRAAAEKELAQHLNPNTYRIVSGRGVKEKIVRSEKIKL